MERTTSPGAFCPYTCISLGPWVNKKPTHWRFWTRMKERTIVDTGELPGQHLRNPHGSMLAHSWGDAPLLPLS